MDYIVRHHDEDHEEDGESESCPMIMTVWRSFYIKNHSKQEFMENQ